MKKESKIIHIDDAKKKYKKIKQISNNYKESKAYIELEKTYIELLQCEYVDTKNTMKEFEKLLDKFGVYFDELYKNTKTEEFKYVKVLEKAIDYSVIGNGKKIRPFIMFVTFMSVIDNYDTLEYISAIRILEVFMVAIEIIHSFSLIHDDLPAIDNDELRRGKLSTWKKFGEDVAILTGDAMIFKAYSIILDMVLAEASDSFNVIMDNIIKAKTTKSYGKKDIEKSYNSILNALCTYNKITYALSIFTKASGNGGMIVGEMYDVLNTHNSKLTKANFSYMSAMKTGSLIGASAIIGAILAEGDDKLIQDISKYTMLLGYIYQLKDDILDEISDEKTLGKTVKSDEKNEKVTFVSKFGIDSAKEEILFLYEECLKVLDELDKKKINTKIFRIIVYYIINRDR